MMRCSQLFRFFNHGLEGYFKVAKDLSVCAATAGFFGRAFGQPKRFFIAIYTSESLLRLSGSSRRY